MKIIIDAEKLTGDLYDNYPTTEAVEVQIFPYPHLEDFMCMKIGRMTYIIDKGMIKIAMEALEKVK